MFGAVYLYKCGGLHMFVFEITVIEAAIALYDIRRVHDVT